MSRFAGKTERRSMVFAQNVLDTVLWIHQSAQGALLASGASWCLDAGCGSGEKTVEFAKCVPSHNVVGLDLSDTLEASYEENKHISNCISSRPTCSIRLSRKRPSRSA